MDDKIPEGLEDLLKGIIEDDEKIPEGLDDLLDSVREDSKSSGGGALATIPKKSDDLVDEEIDSQILSILGLEDVFDLTYEEYASLLKEASIKGRMADSQMTTESIELVTNELKRVKGKTGKFKVKPKKVDINKVLNRKPGAIVKVDSLKPEDKESEAAEDKSDSDEFKKDVNDGINKILGSLITIKSVLDKQKGIEESTAKRERRTEEKREKSRRENKLEKKKEDKKKTKKLPEVKPIGGFFDMIKRFFTNILIGGTVLKIFKWMNDPENKSSIERFKNFMVDNAPLILGGLLAIAALPLASTLLGLTTTIIGGLVTLGGALAGLTALIPGFGWVALGAGIGAAAVFGIRKISEAFYGGDVHGVSEGFDRVDKDLRKRRREIMDMEDGDEKTAAREEYDEIQKKLKGAKDKILTQMKATKSMETQLKYETGKLEYYKSVIEDPKNAKGTELSRISDIENAPEYVKKLEKVIKDLKINIPQSKEKQEKYIEEYFPNGVPKGNIQKIEEFVENSKKMAESMNKSLKNLKDGAASLSQGSGTSGSGTSGSGSTSVGGYEVVPASHPETGSGFGIKSSDGNLVLDANRRPVVFSKEGAMAFAQILQDSGGMVKGSDIASAQRSQAKNTLEGGAPGSKHLTGNAMDIHGDSQIWLKAYGGKYDWNLAPYEGSHGGHFVFGDGGSSAPPPPTTSSAQISSFKPTTPTISSPTGRSGIGGILPIPTGGGGGGGSSSGANQAKVPIFSSDDPNNMSMMVIKGIYNVVG
jgi:hypothetical protein